MDVIHLTPPGRFPTVVHDPGLWWDSLAGGDRHKVTRYSLNYHWWRLVFSKAVVPVLLAPLHPLDRWNHKLSWLAERVDVPSLARAASRALSALETRKPYQSRAAYLDALTPLAEFIETLNTIQQEVSVTIDSGPRAKELDYDDSQALARYARSDTFLRRSIETAFRHCPRTPDLATLSVSSPEDLLTGLIACDVLRKRQPAAHVCLIDHGYENFSLHTHMDELKSTGAFDDLFDSIVVSKDARDDVVPALVEALARRDPVPKYLSHDTFPVRAQMPPPGFVPPPTLPAFVPEPILWTRLSKRRCYWSRCTYCTQNSKYENERAPTRSDILKTLDRLESFVERGCRHFIFSDEAISPSTLRLLAREIESRKLQFYWACRCKIEHAHDAKLFESLGRVGCYEILYGLETTSPRVLKLMDKYVEGLDENRLGEVFREMDAAGIGVHVNMIGGYPGDTLDETRRSVQFMARELSTLRGATYVLNSFALLPDTPMARTPGQFGITKVTPKGDLGQVLEFELSPDIFSCTTEATQEIPRLRDQLDEALGWSTIAPKPVAPIAQALYFGSGHGSIFKSSHENPFANPLLQTSG